MPAWSPEVANDFLRLAAAHGHALEQRQLQALTYIAHGWCLAITGQPLTGDRPLLGTFGPEYELLSKALAPFGVDAVDRPIRNSAIYLPSSGMDLSAQAASELDQTEHDIIDSVFDVHAHRTAIQLSAWTRKDQTPWHIMLQSGERTGTLIPDTLVRAQFLELAGETSQEADAST